ncbi:MAG: NAD(P)H-dependent oxidoreductase [Spirochaetia bacterium]|jgi:putative NADPH-quinone reductase
MKVLEILCNPRPGSYNLALAASAREKLESLGHEVFLHDLYREGFDPVLVAPELARGFSLEGLVQVHCAELAAADGLLVFHPEWWGQPPAVLKGWIDRVFRQGVAYDLEGEDFSEKGWKPLLEGKKGLVFCTSDAAEDSVRTLEALWTRSVLGRCGMKAACHVLRELRRTDAAARRAWLDFVSSILQEWFPAA